MSSRPQTVKPRIYVDSTESLEQTFHELIPISAQMGVKVVSYSGDSLTISAPLAANINHQDSAFGGSLFAVAALAGWGLMQMKLSELLLDCNTVVMGGEVSFERPVYDDLICTCELPADADAVFEALVNTGAASTRMNSSYTSNGKTAMRLNGQYHLKKRT